MTPGSPPLGDARLLDYRPRRAPAVTLTRDEAILTRMFFAPVRYLVRSQWPPRSHRAGGSPLPLRRRTLIRRAENS